MDVMEDGHIYEIVYENCEGNGYLGYNTFNQKGGNFSQKGSARFKSQTRPINDFLVDRDLIFISLSTDFISFGSQVRPQIVSVGCKQTDPRRKAR